MKKVVITFLFLFCLAPFANAEEKKSNPAKESSVELITAVDELECGGTKVVAETTCTADSKPTFKTCTKQTISFKDMKKGGEIIKKIHNENLGGADERVGKNIDAFIWRWACVRGKDRSYLVLEFATGGSCAGCEWDEIYQIDGKKVASKKSKNRTQEAIQEAVEKFQRTYRALGIEKLPRSLFQRIKILKNQE